ncbi:apical endosomal glycoprotein [Microcaecilia unicolor]|uniref:Apical endosomal glycoprotein n=1 Tax=Microcaecilia unicolor TaxID=1415580 RepID=A0A6P7YD24_9AMPH|nr:apical endosomal glycoprotein [Microcaecilia unicolor]
MHGIHLSFAVLLLRPVLLVSDNWCNGPAEKVCNFLCDCWDCSDENMCGYHKKSTTLETQFTCDFEEDDCGWRDVSTSAYQWVRDQDGISTLGTGPFTDHTLKTNKGWYMAAEYHQGKVPATASLRSPVLKEAAATCEIRIHYHIWNAGILEIPKGTLIVQVADKNQTYAVWQGPHTSVYAWREIVLYTGRIPGEFEITISSTRSFWERGDLAIDDVEFWHCGLPLPRRLCPNDSFACTTGACVDSDQVCDGTDDCGDNSDERNPKCGEFDRCAFEQDLCKWKMAEQQGTWTRTNGARPARDHTSNSRLGYFLYAGSNSTDSKEINATLLSPTVQATSDGACFLVLYYYMYGSDTCNLSIKTRASEKLSEVRRKSGDLGEGWFRERVVFLVPENFQIVIEGTIGEGEMGDLALDDLYLSPGCKTVNVSLFTSQDPQPLSSLCKKGEFLCADNTCILEDLVCNFQNNCKAGTDEMNCGVTDFESGDGGWMDWSVGRLKWTPVNASGTLPDKDHTTNSSAGHFLSLQRAGGQHLTAAKVRSPLLGPSGLACTMEMYYYLRSEHAGSITVHIIDPTLGTHRLSWYIQGDQGLDWQYIKIPVGENTRRFQVELASSADSSIIAVDDILFVDCHPNTSLSEEVSCNFEMGSCDWYQDQSDDFDWARDNGRGAVFSSHRPGFDHTLSTGYFLYVDKKVKRGWTARFIAHLISSEVKMQCLSFWYHMYGPHIGTLILKIRYDGGNESLLWTETGSHGNVWHHGFHTLEPQDGKKYQLIFEALYDGDVGDIALDDITLRSEACAPQKHCSFEVGTCGYTSGGGKYTWERQNSIMGSTITGPGMDHTRQTVKGYYMIADTSKTVLPTGQAVLMNSEPYEPFPQERCLEFWYHMSTKSPGSLDVYVEEEEKEKRHVLSVNRKQEDAWHYSSVTIQAERSWKLILEAMTAGEDHSYIAIDDIHLGNHRCPKPGCCDFESGTCGWSNKQSLDSYKWDWTKGEAPSKYPGPKTDHTLGSKEGHYAFFDMSLLDSKGTKAGLLSEHLPATKGSCFKFWYHMDFSEHFHKGELTVKLYTSLGQLTIWSTEGHQSRGWLNKKILMESPVEFQIVFEAIKGIWAGAGTIALDDIEYTEGQNCDVEQAGDQAENTKKKNTGVVVTSVLFVIILLILAILGIRYCIKKQKHHESTAESPEDPDRIQGFDSIVFSTDQENILPLPSDC